jgi:hypothetical protein
MTKEFVKDQQVRVGEGGREGGREGRREGGTHHLDGHLPRNFSRLFRSPALPLSLPPSLPPSLPNSRVPLGQRQGSGHRERGGVCQGHHAHSRDGEGVASGPDHSRHGLHEP